MATYLSQNHRLPIDFKDYHLSMRDGFTVAHLVVKRRYLPSFFTDYHLSDCTGWTVAHTAAFYGHLPSTFNQWHLESKDGQNVLQVFLLNGMKGWLNRTSLFDLQIKNGHPLRVFEAILDKRNHIHGDYKGQLKAEVNAWLASGGCGDGGKIKNRA